jgi:hypothetical protein
MLSDIFGLLTPWKNCGQHAEGPISGPGWHADTVARGWSAFEAERVAIAAGRAMLQPPPPTRRSGRPISCGSLPTLV